MGTNKRIRLILTALLSLSAALPAATDYEAGTLNAAPVITGLESASVAENGTGTVATYSARDSEGDPITWSLSGRDAGAFTFTADEQRQTMTLLFRSVPDYERPADAPPTDNYYQVTVVASDHGFPPLATHYPVRVQVVDVEEASPMPVMAHLQGYAWPGNVRELAYWVERMVILCEGERLERADVLAAEEMELALSAALSAVAPEAEDQGEEPPLAEDEEEKQRIIAALETTNWVASGKRGAHRLLGMSHQTLRYRMRKYGIQRPKPSS